MIVTLEGIFISVKLLQLANAQIPILLRLLGKITFSKLLHPANVRSSILLTLEDSFILFKL